MRDLPSIRDLIRQSWERFLRDWNRTFGITSWLLAAPSVLFVFAIFLRDKATLLGPIALILSVAGAILSIWTSIRVYRFALARDRGEEPEPNEARRAWGLFLPFVLVSVLEGLAVLGGLAAFILPGVWLTGLLVFSKPALLEDGRRGTQTLAASAALVRGRWWPIFTRYVFPSLLFLLLALAALSLMAGAIGAIAGLPKLGVILRADNTDPLAMAVQLLLQGLTQAIFLPLFVTLQVKLFHACKATQK